MTRFARNVALFLTSFILPLSACYADHVLYMVERHGDVLSTIDLTTGSASTVGPVGVDVFFTGLAYDPTNDKFLMTNSNRTERTADLYRVDPDSAAATLIGSTDTNIMSGLAYDPGGGVLYGVTGATDSLYTIDPTTAETTWVGNFGFDADVSGLAFDPNSNTLFMNEILTDSLYRVDFRMR